MFTGAHLVQGILSCLVRRNLSGSGGRVEVSLLESTLDLQFEVFTTFLNDGGRHPRRGSINSAHAYLSAPYGIYATQDGYLAIAMASIPELARALAIPELIQYSSRDTWFESRDVIQNVIAKKVQCHSTAYWLGILEPIDVWCADVLSWERLMQHEGFAALSMTQRIGEGSNRALTTTRCPIRLDGSILTSDVAAPRVGEHTSQINCQFRLTDLQNCCIGLLGPAVVTESFAQRLLNAGVSVVIHDPIGKDSDVFQNLHVQITESPASLVKRSDVILLMLPEDENYLEIICGTDGLCGTHDRDVIVINCCLLSEEASAQLSKVIQDRAIIMLDAPVIVGAGESAVGNAYFLVGGDQAVYEKCIPIFEILGSGHWHMGGLGAGASARRAVMLLEAVHFAALIESLKVATAGGVAPNALLGCLASEGIRNSIAAARSVAIRSCAGPSDPTPVVTSTLLNSASYFDSSTPRSALAMGAVESLKTFSSQTWTDIKSGNPQ